MNKTFTSLTLQCRYRSGDATAKPLEFYNRVLPLCKNYSRAVGFFSSTSLIEISRGICSMICNGGKMRLITSPRLSAEDIDAIEKGYKARDEIIMQAIQRSMLKPQSIHEENRLNILANMIESGFLDIKIAMTENPYDSMYHEKIGVFEDEEQNSIVITGSNNESATAQTKNFESFDVYCSWSQNDAERIAVRKNDFERMWNDEQAGLEVSHFPEFSKMFVEKYKTAQADFVQEAEMEKIEMQELCEKENVECGNEKSFFDFGNKVLPRPHQQKAIAQFVQNDFQCLFAMATGTGKTLTSLFAANELSKYIYLESILIIVPLKDLVDQWQIDIKKYYDGELITIRSGIEWKSKIENRNLLKIVAVDSDANHRVVIITTYDSFCANDEKILKSLNPENTLIIADEVHKFGAESYSQKLPEKLKYRIGLSATPKRPYDDKGTKAIFDYFCPSSTAYEFSIKDAIENEMLCHYNYHPILVELTEDEIEQYEILTDRISKLSVVANSESCTKEDKEKLQKVLKERHRIIEHAENKKDKFLDIITDEIKKYKNKTIIFCPEGKNENGIDYLTDYKSELSKKLMASNQFVSMHEYVQGTDKKIIDAFSAGAIDMIFAKQRLNEGIDIPSTKRAFFIASSTSEREFIQRRGRVLRKSQGKTIAEIFDFIVVPSETLRDENIRHVIIDNEIKRAVDFIKTADNYIEVEKKLKKYL